MHGQQNIYIKKKVCYILTNSFTLSTLMLHFLFPDNIGTNYICNITNNWKIFLLRKRNGKDQNVTCSYNTTAQETKQTFLSFQDKLVGYFEFQEVLEAPYLRRVRPRIVLASA